MGAGARNRSVHQPGDAQASLVWRRIIRENFWRMPPIASEVVDTEGVALVRRWIESLDLAAGGSQDFDPTVALREASGGRPRVERKALENEVGSANPHRRPISAALRSVFIRRLSARARRRRKMNWCGVSPVTSLSRRRK